MLELERGSAPANARTLTVKAPPRPQACAEVESILQDHLAWGGAQGKDFFMTAGRALPYLDGRQPHGFGSSCLGRPAFRNVWKLSCAPRELRCWACLLLLTWYARFRSFHCALTPD